MLVVCVPTHKGGGGGGEATGDALGGEMGLADRVKKAAICTKLTSHLSLF